MRIPAVAVFTILLVASMVFISYSNSAYAEHQYDDDYSNDPEYAGKTSLRFYQIFASKDTWYNWNCDDAKNSKLKSKASQVLKMYDYLPLISRQECVTVTGEVDTSRYYEDNNYGLSLEQVTNKAKDWHYDLLIIILDDTFSSQFKESALKEWGVHNAAGITSLNMNTIVSTTDSWGIENEHDGVYVLAHEIGHFAVNQKYPHDIYKLPPKDITSDPDDISNKAVHDASIDSWSCGNYSNEMCPELWVPLKTFSGDPVLIVSPEYTMQVADSLLPISLRYQEPASISVWTDKTSYQYGDIIRITGKISNFKYSKVLINVIGPSGKIESSNPSIGLNNNGEFSLLIKNNFPSIGKYKIDVFHSTSKGAVSFSHVNPSVSSQLPSKPIAPTPQPQQPILQNTTPESLPTSTIEPKSLPRLFVNADKSSYVGFEPITIEGSITNFDSGWTTMVRLFAPSGNHVFSEDVTPDSSGKFSITFAPRTLIMESGTYAITLEHQYIESKKSYFDYIDVNSFQNKETIEDSHKWNNYLRENFLKRFDSLPKPDELQIHYSDEFTIKFLDEYYKKMGDNINAIKEQRIYDVDGYEESAAVYLIEQEKIKLEALRNDLLTYENQLYTSTGISNNYEHKVPELFGLERISTGLVNTKQNEQVVIRPDPKQMCGPETELVNDICQIIQKSNPTKFNNIPTGLVNTKNVDAIPECGTVKDRTGPCKATVSESKPNSNEKFCFLFWCW